MSLDQKPVDLEIKKPNELNLNEYQLLKILGEGAYGKVKLAQNKQTNEYIAIKQLQKIQVMKNKQIDHLKNESYILYSLDHPFIVKMKGITQDEKFVYIAMEFVGGGELFTYLRMQEKFTIDQTSFYSAQIILVFEYLHSKNVVYRDLKPENLLICSDGYLKLTDFGFAKVVDSRTFTLCGTPEYLAPEILTNQGHGKGVDWWTLGIMMYEMLIGIDPFNDNDPMSVYNNILKSKVRFPRKFDKSARSLIKRLLQPDLSQRYGNMIGGAFDIKNHRFFDSINWDDIYNKKIDAEYKPDMNGEIWKNFGDYQNEDESKIQAINQNEDPFRNW